ncbi:MAG TPA: sigma-70 family RNA polymerase sigma factor [Solirubrobacteraceae bacterium]|nr:sigma-70 family RNA polymerase sigma factor [Solirubrobacteraceae bacterium]
MGGATVSAERQRAELAALVEAARGGEQAAWNELVARLGRLVWSVTRAYRLDPQDADDVAQIAWMRLAENIDRLSDPGSVGAWLATTTKRECIAMLRHRARVQPVDVDVLAAQMMSPAADADVFTSERDRLVWSAFKRLSERCQRLLHLAVADKDSGYLEIAALLDMPVGSVGPTRERCLDRLRQLLGSAGISSFADAST